MLKNDFVGSFFVEEEVTEKRSLSPRARKPAGKEIEESPKLLLNIKKKGMDEPSPLL